MCVSTAVTLPIFKVHCAHACIPKCDSKSWHEWITRSFFFPTENSEEWNQKRAEIKKTLHGEEIDLLSPEGHLLNGMLFPASQTETPQSAKAIIFAPGMDGYYEDSYTTTFVSFLRSKLKNFNIFIVNYPSVMKSRGNLNISSMASTIFSAFYYLVEARKWNPNNIVIHGQSLGGLAAIFGARLAQTEYPSCRNKLINERSFFDLPQTLEIYVGGFLGMLVRKFVESPQWSTPDSIQAFKEFKGEKLIIYSDHDGVVSKEVSFAQAILNDKVHVAMLRMMRMEGSQYHDKEHLRPFSAMEEDLYVSEILRMFETPL